MLCKTQSRIRCALITLVLLCAGLSGIWAEPAPSLTVGPVLSWGYGDIYEYVFNYHGRTQTMLSRLDWDVHNAFYAGGVFEMKSNEIGFHFQYKQLLTTGPGFMDDYDWQNSTDPTELTNHSQHINEVQERKDFLVEASLPFLKLSKSRFSVLVGFQYLYTWMDSRDGWKTYKDDGWQRIEMSGPAISYGQKIEMLWFGATGDFFLNPNLTLTADLAFSPWLYSFCEDIHWVRYYGILSGHNQSTVPFHFLDTPVYGWAFKAGISAAYSFGKMSQIVLSCGFMTIPEAVGNDSTQYYNNTTFTILYGALGGTGYLGWDVSLSYRIRIF